MKEFINKIFNKDCFDILNKIPNKSVDLLFADPPYNLQLDKKLTRPDQTAVNGVHDYWDKFDSYKQYDEFTYKWLKESKRILKENGSLWVIGSYHNIYRVGKMIQDLDMWILNDIIWQKTNPMPNFRGTRFTNAHETLIWCTVSKKSKYTFNYNSMKNFNDDKQMRSNWDIPVCTGKERLKNKNNSRAHPTQKPEALLNRVIISSTNPGDLVLDPFMGSGTTVAVAKKLNRDFIGVEKDKKYFNLAKQRLKNTFKLDAELINIKKGKRHLTKVAFGELVEQGIIPPGAILTDKKQKYKAVVSVDGSIKMNDFSGSIHQVGAKIQGLPSCNGWDFWHVKKNSSSKLLDNFRDIYRNKKNSSN